MVCDPTTTTTRLPTETPRTQRLHRDRFTEFSGDSKHQFQLRKQRIQRLRGIDYRGLAKVADVRRAITRSVREDVTKAEPGLQRRRAECELHVIDQKRPVLNAHAVIPTDFMPNMILKQNVFQRFRAMETQIVNVEDRFHALSNIGVNARVVNKDARIHKVSLALKLTAAQTRQDAIGLDQANARLGQPDAVAIPK